ncbi:MAG: transporter substrate-binding domain-containing protein [Thalassotalea sp.]|nr:transporter substrate-binding domain-containing protein [Thalassotalea sp.]
MTRLLLLIAILNASLCAALPKTANGNELQIGVFDDHQLYLDMSGPYRTGWAILNMAAERANIRIVPKPDAWARGLYELKSGHLDGVYGAIPNEERLVWAKFLLPLSYEQIYVYAPMASPLNKLDEIDMSTASVGVSKDSIQHNLANSLGFSEVYAILDRNVQFKLLQANRVDYLIYSSTFVNIYCAKFDSELRERCLKPLRPALSSRQFSVMYNKSSKTHNKLYQALDAALVDLYEQGVIQTLYRQHFAQESKAYEQWKTFWKQALDENN